MIKETNSADPFVTLNVATSATAVEIKKAYFEQVRAHPPEKDPAGFKLVRAAYEQINTPEAHLDTVMRGILLLPEVVLPPAHVDATLRAQDVILAARAMGDLAQDDWRSEFREIVQ